MFSFEDNRDRHAYTYHTLYRWLMLKAQGGSVGDFFRSRGISALSVYGVGEMGALFYSEISTEEKTEVLCFADRKAEAYPNGLYGIPVKTPEEFARENAGEVLVVTPVFHMNQITTGLLDCGIPPHRILSLNQVIRGSLQEKNNEW